MVLLDRCQQTILDSISRQQGGFQKQLGCNMSTFVFRETLHWAREQSATVYVCCLDGRQAFDNVWHDGLFYKLIKLGLDNSTLLALRAMYKDASCHVKHCGLRSKNFPVMQGTKQGGRSSPILYLAFIDGLIKELEDSGQGVCMYGTNVSSPTFADDMTIITFSNGRFLST